MSLFEPCSIIDLLLVPRIFFFTIEAYVSLFSVKFSLDFSSPITFSFILRDCLSAPSVLFFLFVPTPAMTAVDSDVSESDSLLNTIQRAFPDAHAYTIEDNIKQANAEGFVVTVHGINKNSTNLFVKTVEANSYSHKPWGDLRRTLLYSRTEARFYSDILPLLKEKTSDWDIAPNCFLAETTLNGLIEEHESTSAKPSDSEDDPSYTENDTTILDGRGGLLVLESFKSNEFFQTSPLTPREASRCLEAIAQFHATAYQDNIILEIVSDKLCEYGGSYHLKNRNPKELTNIQKTWSDFCDGIRTAAPELFERESIQNLGKRIQDMAEEISAELSPTYDDKYATVVHGDYKAMNVFIKEDDRNGDSNSLPIIIDFASTGLGLGMSDAAMHTYALRPENLVDGGEEKLVEQYLDALERALPDHQSYPRDVAMRHYRLAVIDYFRFVMGRLWRGATLETFEKRKDSKNSVYVNRSIEAAINFIERADKYLTEIEIEAAKS